MPNAKIIQIGNERLLPLPHDIAFQATDVNVTIEQGKLVVSVVDDLASQTHVKKSAWAWLDSITPFDEEFVSAISEIRHEQPQQRDELDNMVL